MSQEKIIFNVDLNTEPSEQAMLRFMDSLKDLEKQSEKTGKVLDDIPDSLKDQIPLIDRLKLKEKELREARDKSLNIKDIRNYNEELRKTQKELQNLGKESGKAGSSLADMFKNGLAAFGGFAAGQAAAGALQSGFQGLVDREQIETSFEVIIGSSEKAKASLASLTEFAKTTPFELPQVQQAARSLLAFGISAEELEPTLRKLGDVAAGTNTPINELAEIFGKAKVQGRLFMEDINQLTGRGINVRTPIMEMLGLKTGEEFNKAVEEGKVGFEQLSQAFQKLSGEGGQFFGLMEKQSQTLGGQLSNLKDEFQGVLVESLEPLMPVFKDIVALLILTVKGFGELAEALVNLPKFINENRTALGLLAAGIVALDFAMAGTARSMVTLTLAKRAWTAGTVLATSATRALTLALVTNPFIAVATALTAVVVGIIAYKNSIDEATLTQEEFNEKTKEVSASIDRQANESVANEISKLNELVAKIKDTNLSQKERQAALDELQSKYPSYFQNIDLENLKISELDAAYKKLAESILKSARQRIATEKMRKEIEQLTSATMNYESAIGKTKVDSDMFGPVDASVFEEESKQQLNSLKKLSGEALKLNQTFFELQAMAIQENEKNGELSAKTLARIQLLQQKALNVSNQLKSLLEDGNIEKTTQAYQEGIKLAESLVNLSATFGNADLFIEANTESLAKNAVSLGAASKAQKTLRTDINITKEEINSQSDALEKLNNSILDNVANLERDLANQSRVSSSSPLEQIIFGSEGDMEKTLNKIRNQTEDAVNKIAKDLEEKQNKLQEKLADLQKNRSQYEPAAFEKAVKEVNDNIAALNRQSVELQTDALALGSQAEDNALRENYLKRAIELNNFANKLNAELDKENIDLAKQRLDAINNLLKQSVSDKGGIEQVFSELSGVTIKQFNEGIGRTNLELESSESKIRELQGKLSNMEPGAERTSLEAQLGAEIARRNKLKNDILKIELSKVDALEKLKLEEKDRLDKIDEDLFKKEQERIARQGQVIQEIFQTAYSGSSGSQFADKIRQDLFKIGDALFEILGFQANTEIEMFRKKEAEKLKIQAEYTKQRLQLELAAAKGEGDENKINTISEQLAGIDAQISGYDNLAKSMERLISKKKEGALTEQEQAEQTQNYINLAAQGIQMGLDLARGLSQIQSQQLAQSIANQTRQVEQARSSAAEGRAELLQENEKVLNELREQERSAAEQRINIAMAEMAAKSLVAIATAAAQGGVAAAITIPIVIASMLAGFAIMKEQAKAQGSGLSSGFRYGGYTGDVGVDNVAGVVHGREFVFTAEQTRANRDIFESIHKGSLDLRSELNKARMLEDLLDNQLVFKRDMSNFMFDKVGSYSDNSALLERLENLEKAIKQQDRLAVSINEKGIYAITSKIEYDNQRLRSISK
jgi:hypothetical protein